MEKRRSLQTCRSIQRRDARRITKSGGHWSPRRLSVKLDMADSRKKQTQSKNIYIYARLGRPLLFGRTPEARSTSFSSMPAHVVLMPIPGLRQISQNPPCHKSASSKWKGQDRDKNITSTTTTSTNSDKNW